MNYPKTLEVSPIIAGCQVNFVASHAKLKQLNPETVYTVTKDNGSRVSLLGIDGTIKKDFLCLSGSVTDVEPMLEGIYTSRGCNGYRGS